MDNKLIAKQRSNPLSGGPLEIHNLVVEAILEGRFTDALGVIFSVPRDQRGYDMSLCLAMSLSGIGLHDSARAELDELKFLADSDPQWGLVRALTFFREGRFKEAFDCLISARHAERHPLCEPSFFSSYDFEELLDRCRAKLHDEWYARSGEPPEFWDLRLEKMELPFGYIEEMDVSPPAEIRAMYYGIPGVLPELKPNPWVDNVMGDLQFGDHCWDQPAKKDAWWSGLMTPPFEATLQSRVKGVSFQLSMNLNYQDEPTRALFRRLERLGLVNDGWSWRSYLVGRILAIKPSMLSRVRGSAARHSFTLAVADDFKLYHELLETVSEAIRRLYAADRLKANPSPCAFSEYRLGNRWPEEAIDLAGKELGDLDCWIRDGLAVGGRLWVEIRDRCEDAVFSVGSFDRSLLGDELFLETFEGALETVLDRYEVDPQVAHSAMRFALGELELSGADGDEAGGSKRSGRKGGGSGGGPRGGGSNGGPRGGGPGGGSGGGSGFGGPGEGDSGLKGGILIGDWPVSPGSGVGRA